MPCNCFSQRKCHFIPNPSWPLHFLQQNVLLEGQDHQLLLCPQVKQANSKKVWYLDRSLKLTPVTTSNFSIVSISQTQWHTKDRSFLKPYTIYQNSRPYSSSCRSHENHSSKRMPRKQPMHQLVCTLQSFVLQNEGTNGGHPLREPPCSEATWRGRLCIAQSDVYYFPLSQNFPSNPRIKPC